MIIITTMTMKTTRMMTTTMKKVYQLWVLIYMIDTWGFPEDIKDMDDDNNNYNDGKDDHNYSTTAST